MSSRLFLSLYRGLVRPQVTPNSSFSTSSISLKILGDKMTEFKDSVEKDGKKLVEKAEAELEKAETELEKAEDKMAEVHEKYDNDIGGFLQNAEDDIEAISESVEKKSKGQTDAVEDVK
ncbi:hypothetical protein JTE90_016465 [Oedothorax gibbosus]|uniref:Uncharacterized protein n=1 Tax=Oedothorax gibbosus TaxID=931172 RepID=A0AAV6V6G6_9ARAC|nr:hypothetical protein JTE90_016465 [Oedothorax gibbosus]